MSKLTKIRWITRNIQYKHLLSTYSPLKIHKSRPKSHLKLKHRTNYEYDFTIKLELFDGIIPSFAVRTLSNLPTRHFFHNFGFLRVIFFQFYWVIAIDFRLTNNVIYKFYFKENFDNLPVRMEERPFWLLFALWDHFYCLCFWYWSWRIYIEAMSRSIFHIYRCANLVKSKNRHT